MRKTEEFFDWNADEIAFQLFHGIVVNISIISNKAEENWWPLCLITETFRSAFES